MWGDPISLIGLIQEHIQAVIYFGGHGKLTSGYTIKESVSPFSQRLSVKTTYRSLTGGALWVPFLTKFKVKFGQVSISWWGRLWQTPAGIPDI